MELAEIKVDTFGGSPVAEHNMPCAVCRKKHAVLHLDVGMFGPCWDCHAWGYRLIQKGTWLQKLLYRIGWDDL